MSAPNEPRLPLDDRKQFLTQYLQDNWLGSDSSWYIFNHRGELWLGVRTHDLGGTDYSYKQKVSLEEAEWLMKQEIKSPYKTRPETIHEFMNAISTYRKPTYEQLQKALHLAVAMLAPYEPGDSRAVSDEFVALACITNNDAHGNTTGAVMKIIDEALAREASKKDKAHAV